MSNYDNQGKGVLLTVPISSTNATDGVIKAVKNGSAYAVVPEHLQVDTVYLQFALSAAVNTDGSGTFGVGLYINNVAVHTAALAVSYSSANSYATLDRASITNAEWNEGDILRVDVINIFGGAATAYPQNAVVTVKAAAVD